MLRWLQLLSALPASMKALPKRKGNSACATAFSWVQLSLNESPSKKEGKFAGARFVLAQLHRLNESPSKKEGKFKTDSFGMDSVSGLNESPSKKEGKLATRN